MPQQAILDLPVLEFEAFRDAQDRLHEHCTDIYGISGLTPHSDAAFHLGASLWRYREAESARQVAGLAACYLTALADYVAARRRLAAARSSTRSLKRIRDAEEDVEDASHHLDEVSRVLSEFVDDMMECAAHDPHRARRRLQANLEAMGEHGWSSAMQHAAEGFIAGKPRVRWTDSLMDVLDALEATALPLSGNGHGRTTALEERVVEHLERELEEYRELATTASARLRQVDDERRDLVQLLSRSETDSTGRSLELEQARNALEESLAAARDRLAKLEHDIGPGLREELQHVRIERDRLADELLSALSSATESEVSREEMLDHIEQAAGDRMQAAEAIGSLSTRLDAVQRDAESTAERAEAYRQRMNELEDDRNALRAELANAAQSQQQAIATIEALEKAANRKDEYRRRLEDAESRLAEAESKHDETRMKVRALTSELDDTLSTLESTRETKAGFKAELDRAASRLAEAQSAANARTLLLDREIERLNERLRAETQRADSTRRDKERADRALAELQPHLDELRDSRAQLTERLKALEGSAAETARHMKQRDTDTGRLRNDLEEARKRAAGLEAELAKAKHEFAAGRERPVDAAETAVAREQLGQARHELAAAQAEQVTLHQQAAEMREELRARTDLADDRQRKMEEKLALLAERIRRQDDERNVLLEALSRQEQGRADEKNELEQVADRAAREVVSARQKLQQSQDQLRKLQDKLAEAESFLIARQRDLEKSERRTAALTEAIGAVADLRTEYEKTKPEKKRAQIASQISRRLDTLFSEAGRPIHADRKTEKILILHVKNDEETAHEKPSAPTKRRSKSGPASAEGDNQAQSKRS